MEIIIKASFCADSELHVVNKSESVCQIDEFVRMVGYELL